MMRTYLLSLLTLAGIELSAQPVALTGKVADPSGKAIAGAIVRLKSKSLADTTDASGTYSLNGAAASLDRPEGFSGNGTAAWRDGKVAVELAAPRRVRLEFYGAQGNLLGTVEEPSLPRGLHRFDAKPLAAGAIVPFVRVAIGHQAALLRGPLAKPGALEDSLEATALGYRARTVSIAAYEGRQDITLTSDFTGTCAEPRAVNTTVRGSGAHSVVVETHPDEGIKEGTIYRPADLGPGQSFPILVWGEGACARNGLDNAASMAELASHGYFVIADGTPNGTGSRPMNANNLAEMGRPVLAYIAWAIAENRKPCSKYYRSLDTSRIDVNGFSCGGLLAMGAAKDPRITTWGLTSSGSFGDNPTLWRSVHTPVLIIQGHKDATGAYTNGLRDFNGIAPLGQPVLFLSHRNLAHGGDLWSANGGDFTRIHLAWVNWWLKGDLGSKGKGALVGPGCTYCTNANWEVKTANLP